jgi:hypothetical protein
MAIFKSLLKSGLLGCLLVCAAASGWAQTGAAPAPGASCVVTAQNRTAPLSPSGDYVLYNLPGNGLAPFGTDGSAQPFRIRATCDDGTVGETPMTFPAFEQRVVNPGTITWGLNTPVPEKLTLHLPAATLSEGQSMQAGVVAAYAGGITRDVTARATGTGYRSSAAAFVGVGAGGSVFMQPAWVQSIASSAIGAPPQVVITAENDGVVGSRVVQMVSARTISGRVLLADGSAAPAGFKVRLMVQNGWQADALTSAGGNYSFEGIPVGYLYGTVAAFNPAGRDLARSAIGVPAASSSATVNLRLAGMGTLRVRVVDVNGVPVPGLDVSYADEAQRSGLFAGAAPAARTDAGGVVEFSGVSAGAVTALVAAAVREMTPGATQVPPGGLAEVQVRVGDPPGSPASIGGTVVQQPQGTPAVGARVQLIEQSGLRRTLSQPVSPSGAFRFDDLMPGASHLVSVLQSGVVQVSRAVTSGPAQSEVRADFSIPAQLRVSGIVFQSDATTRVPAASIQLSAFSSGTWSFMRSYTTDASGSFNIGPLSQWRYRLDVLAANGGVTSVELDLAAASGTVQRDIVLGAPVEASTRVRVRAWVMGLQSAADLNAQVSVTNVRCPAGCALGSLPRTLAPLTTDLLPPGLNTFDVVWRGRRQTFQVNVSAATHGQTLEREVDFPPDLTGSFSFLQQRSLYTFAAAAGESLDLVAVGPRVGQVTSSYAVKMEVFGPDNTLVAQGHGFDERVIPPDWSAIRGWVVPATGTYTLVLSPYYENPDALGMYGVMAHAANPRVLQAWPAIGPGLGGRVGGRVLLPSGVVAPGETIRVAAGPVQGPQLVEQVQTQADGTYRYDNLPLGLVDVTARDGGVTLARGTTTLAAAGQAATVDLVLAKRTQLDVSVRVSNDLPAYRYVSVSVQDDQGERTSEVSFPDGTTTSNVTRVLGVGDSVTLGATHPHNARISANRVVQGNDGQVVPVQLELLTGRVSGRVVGSSGQPVPWASVMATSLAGDFMDATNSDSQGVYQFAALSGGQTVRIQALDPSTGIGAQLELTVVGEQAITAPDLVLQSGSVTGRVRDAAGQPVAYHPVDMLVADGTYLYAETDDQGVFRLDVVPVGQEIEVVASHPVNGSSARTTFVARAGELTTLPDLVFAGTATVSGRVRLSNGQPLEGAPVILTNDPAAKTCPDVDNGGGGSPLSVTLGVVRLEAVTGSDGRFSITDVPQGASFRVAAALTSLACVEQSVQVSVAQGAQTATVADIVFPATGGSLFLQVTDGAGMPVKAPGYDYGECVNSIRITQPDGTLAVVSAPPVAGRRYDNVQLGAYSAQISVGCEAVPGYGATTVTSQGVAPLPVVIPMIRGSVRFADGGVPDDYSVSLTQQDANGNVRYYSGERLNSGGVGLMPLSFGSGQAEFMVYGMSPGSYEIQAGDYQHGLTLVQTGTFATTPGGIVDLVFPPSATVRGCAKLADGSPAQPIYLYLWTTMDTGRYATPDAQGCYEFQRVQTGPAVLTAHDQNDQLLGLERFMVAASVDHAIVQQDLRYVPRGTLKILLKDASGAPLAGRRVWVQAQQMEPAARSIFANGYSSSAGTVSFQLYPGPYSVNAWPTGNDRSSRAGATAVYVVSAQSVTTTLSDVGRFLLYRDSAYLYDDALLTDGVGFMATNAGGFFTTQSQRFQFHAGLVLYVNGMRPSETVSADFPAGGREISLGPYMAGQDLQVSRRLFVPPAGGYGRVVDSVTNRSAAPQTVLLESRTTRWLWSCDAVGTTMPQNSPRGYVAFEDCLGSVAHVYASPQAPVQAARVDAPGGAGSSLQWSLTVQPGQTASIMHFHLVGEQGRVSVLADKASAIVNGTEPTMLQGLSLVDRQNIRNFNLGP